VNARGGLPAREAFNSLDESDRAKVLTLFKYLADQGRINNREKFQQLGAERTKGEAGRYWEFKSFQDRFIGDFRPGKRFLVAAYVKKKGGNLPLEVLERAVRVMHENDAWEENERNKRERADAKGVTRR
jgi:hypothetical protein